MYTAKSFTLRVLNALQVSGETLKTGSQVCSSSLFVLQSTLQILLNIKKKKKEKTNKPKHGIKIDVASSPGFTVRRKKEDHLNQIDRLLLRAEQYPIAYQTFFSARR